MLVQFKVNASVRDYLVGFLLPTLLGNSIGGVALVAMLNHAPLAQDLRGDADGEGSAAPGRGTGI